MKLSKLTQFLGIAALSAFALAACSVSPSDDSDPSEADEAEAETTDEALTSGVSTYYTLRRDFRRCMFPICGGYFVSRVNQPTTRCADGNWAASCYVAELNLTGLNLDEATVSEIPGDTSTIVLRGYVNKKAYANLGSYGNFRATEAWRAPAAGADLPTGTFYILDDSNIRCFRAPCPSTRERKLNSSANPKNITSVDLLDAPGTDAQKSDALGQINSRGLIVAGANVGPASARVLDGNQFYTRVQKAAGLPAGAECSGADVCGAGLKCCYPCGIQGCTNRCITPDASGQCPMFP
jgi:hypothetical protein